jgi:hypothetical protein
MRGNGILEVSPAWFSELAGGARALLMWLRILSMTAGCCFFGER